MTGIAFIICTAVCIPGCWYVPEVGRRYGLKAQAFALLVQFLALVGQVVFMLRLFDGK